MTCKDMKKYSGSSIIKEIQIKILFLFLTYQISKENIIIDKSMVKEEFLYASLADKN